MSAAPRPTLVDSRRQFWWGEHELIDYGVPARIGTSAWTIYTCLLRHVNAKSITFPSVQLLMAESGLSNRVVAKSIGVLKDARLIDVDRTTHQWNEYRVLDALDAITHNGWTPVKEARDEKSPADDSTGEHVTKSHLARDEKSPEQVTKSHTKKNQLKTTRERGGEAREASATPTPPARSSSKVAARTHGGPDQAGTPLTSTPPDGGAADAAGQDTHATSQVQDQPPVGTVDQATSTEQVPGAAGGPSGDQDSPVAASVDALRSVPASELSTRVPARPESAEYRALLSLCGKGLGGYLQEYTRTGSIPRTQWLRLTLAELELVRVTAQQEARAENRNMLTLAVRGLDRLIGARSAPHAPGSGTRPAAPTVTPNGSSLNGFAPVEQVADVASTDRYGQGARWQARTGGAVVTIERTSSTPTKNGTATLYHLSDGRTLKMFELMQGFDHVG